MQDYAKIERNVLKMVDQNAPIRDIDAYLASEGLTPEQFRNRPRGTGSDAPPPVPVPREHSMFKPGVGSDLYMGALTSLNGLLAQQGPDIVAANQAMSQSLGAIPKAVRERSFEPIKDAARHGWNKGGMQTRAMIGEARRVNPVGSAINEIGGGLLTGGTLARGVSAAPTLAGRTAQAATGGAAASALAMQADSGGDLEDRLDAAKQGAQVGAAVGGLSPTVAKATNRLLFKPAGKLISRVFSQRGSKGRKAEAQRQAIAKYLEALERDGMDLEEVQLRLDDMAKEGRVKPEALMDLGGANVRNLADSIAQIPGKPQAQATDFLVGRQAQQQSRVMADMARSTGVDASQYLDDLGAISARQRDAAEPLYEAFEQMPGVPMEELSQFTRRPTFKRAINEAIDAAKDQDEFFPDGILEQLADGEVTDQMVIPPQYLDRIKKTLDAMVGSALRSNADDSALKYQRVKSVRNSFRDFLDERYPDTYKAARDAWAGPEAIKSAMEEGEGALRTSPDVIRSRLAEMDASEVDGFKRGFVRALSDRFGNQPTGSNRSRVFDTPFMDERIRAVMGDQAEQFIEDMNREGDMFRSLGVLGNSATARRLAGMKDAETAADITEAMGIATDAASANPLTMIRAALRAGRVVEAKSMLPETQEELGRMLFSPATPDDVRSLIVARMRELNPPPGSLMLEGSLAGATAATSSQQR